MEKLLSLYTYIDGVNDTPFPNSGKQVIITDFRYDAKRMGAVPTISCTVKHSLCLDKLWTDNVYATFKGEKFFIKQTATSSYDNTDSRYKHDIELVSERIILDNVYFYDAVSSDTDVDKPVSNSSDFTFFGDIHEYASRLNHSLKRSNLAYTVVVDDGISSEAKMLSFSNLFFSQALQESYNTYEIPYYFEGKVIHIGFTNNAITHTFKYGKDESLLSIQKQNTNYKIINRVTGVGSSENIPYYYPNSSPKGEIQAVSSNIELEVAIDDGDKFANKVATDGVLTYREAHIFDESFNDTVLSKRVEGEDADYKFTVTPNFEQSITIEQTDEYCINYEFHPTDTSKKWGISKWTVILLKDGKAYKEWKVPGEDRNPSKLPIVLTEGNYTLTLNATVYVHDEQITEFVADFHIIKEYSDSWVYNNVNYKLSDVGLRIYRGTPTDGDTIRQEILSYIQPQQSLMPPIYRETMGEERFYNALNNKYISPQTGEYYTFENEYIVGKPKEHIVNFEDIKPTIKGILNASKQNIDVFSAFAFDTNDNDEVDENGKYLHPYFFAKLRKIDGEYGFNLFNQSIENGEMTISMTSGNCAACEFVIAVDSKTQKNIVQVDENGNLVRDEDGNIKFGTAQDRQNDTANYEVWIALEKDEKTFGEVMPNVKHNYKPNAGDSFVILNINLPQSYIAAAENRLKQELIKYMAMNNSEKFNFAITFSRIFFAENPTILTQLDENARIQIEYDNTKYELYVSSYSYNVTADKALPEVKVELSDTLTIQQNALQTAISEVKQDIMSSTGSIDWLKLGIKYFLRKDVADRTPHKLASDTGFEVGRYIAALSGGFIGADGNAELLSLVLRGFLSSPMFRDGFTGEGWKIWLDENGLSHLTIDKLTVRQIMTIFELLIAKIRAMNGGLIISAANGKIKNVRTDNEYYIIRFEDTNQYIAGDHIRCQTFTGTSLKSYWVEIDYEANDEIYIKKDKFTSFVPEVGDETVLCGSKNKDRQGLIHLSAIEGGKPKIEVLDGVDDFTFANHLRVREGYLGDIYDAYFGDNQPHGYGLYSDNAYLKGDFILRNTGESVETKFQITDNGIKSVVSSLPDTTKPSILYNSNFANSISGWITHDTVAFYLSDGTSVFNDGKAAYDGEGAKLNIEYIDGKYILNIGDSYIKQLNDYYVNKPTTDALVPLAFNLKVMAHTSVRMLAYLDNCTIPSEKAKAFKGVAELNHNGTNISIPLTLGNGKQLNFTGVNGNIVIGDEIAVVYKNENYELYNITKRTQITFSSVQESKTKAQAPEKLNDAFCFIGFSTINQTNDYIAIEFESEWNGTGDFVLDIVGEASIFALQLYTNETEVRHATLFEQSEKLIKIAAANFDADGNVIESSEIMTEADGIKLETKYFNTDGSLKDKSGLVIKSNRAGIYTEGENGDVATIGTYENGVVKLTGNEIQLEGQVTANGNVEIREDGTLKAVNGEFEGKVTATSGDIGGFSIKDGKLQSGANASLQFGDNDFNTEYAVKEYEVPSTLNGSPTNYVETSFTFNCKQVNETTVTSVVENQNWLNFMAANILEIEYMGNTSATGQSTNRYGYQYAMLGQGHVCLNAIVEGACLDVISYTAEEGVTDFILIKPPLYGNRIAFNINGSGFGYEVAVLPDLLSIQSTLGLNFTSKFSAQTPFSFKLNIINVSTTTGGKLCLCGRGTLPDGRYNIPQFPRLVVNGEFKICTDEANCYQLARFRAVEIMLVYTGGENGEYYAIIETN